MGGRGAERLRDTDFLHPTFLRKTRPCHHRNHPPPKRRYSTLRIGSCVLHGQIFEIIRIISRPTKVHEPHTTILAQPESYTHFRFLFFYFYFNTGGIRRHRPYQNVPHVEIIVCEDERPSIIKGSEVWSCLMLRLLGEYAMGKIRREVSIASEWWDSTPAEHDRVARLGNIAKWAGYYGGIVLALQSPELFYVLPDRPHNTEVFEERKGLASGWRVAFRHERTP